MSDRVQYINIGPFPGYVGFTTSEDAYRREMKRLKVDDPTPFTKNAHSNAATHFFENGDGERTTIICMPPARRKESREQYAGLLAHEATHVIQDMRERLGDLGSEAEAYLVQNIVQCGLQQAWKTGRTRKKRP